MIKSLNEMRKLCSSVGGYENKRRSEEISHQRSPGQLEISELKAGQGPTIRDTPEGLRKSKTHDSNESTSAQEIKSGRKDVFLRGSKPFRPAFHLFAVVVLVLVSQTIAQGSPPVETTTFTEIESKGMPSAVYYISGQLPNEVKSVLDNAIKNIIALGIFIITTTIISCCFTCKFEFFKCMRIFLAILFMFGVFIVCVKLVNVDYNMFAAPTHGEKETGVPLASTSDDPRTTVDTWANLIRLVLASVSGSFRAEVPNDLGDEEIPPEQARHEPISVVLWSEHMHVCSIEDDLGPDPSLSAGLTSGDKEPVANIGVNASAYAFNLSEFVHHGVEHSSFPSSAMIARIELIGSEILRLKERYLKRCDLIEKLAHTDVTYKERKCNESIRTKIEESIKLNRVPKRESKHTSMNYQYSPELKQESPNERVNNNKHQQLQRGGLKEDERESGNSLVTESAVEEPQVKGEHVESDKESEVQQTRVVDVASFSSVCLAEYLSTCNQFGYPVCCTGGDSLVACRQFGVANYIVSKIEKIYDQYKKCLGVSEIGQQTYTVDAESEVEEEMKVYQTTVGEVWSWSGIVESGLKYVEETADNIQQVYDGAKQVAGSVKEAYETATEGLKNLVSEEADTLEAGDLYRVSGEDDIIDPERYQQLVNIAIQQSSVLKEDHIPLNALDLPTHIETSLHLSGYWKDRPYKEPFGMIQAPRVECDDSLQLSHIQPCQAQAYVALPGDRVYSHGAYHPLFMELGITEVLVHAFETIPDENLKLKQPMIHHTSTGNKDKPFEFVTTAGNLKSYIRTMVEQCYRLPKSQPKSTSEDFKSGKFKEGLNVKFQIEHVGMYLNHTEMCLAYSASLYRYLEQAYQARNFKLTETTYSDFGFLNLDHIITRHISLGDVLVGQSVRYSQRQGDRVGLQPARMVPLTDYVRPDKYEVPLIDREAYLAIANTPGKTGNRIEGRDWSSIVLSKERASKDQDRKAEDIIETETIHTCTNAEVEAAKDSIEIEITEEVESIEIEFENPLEEVVDFETEIKIEVPEAAPRASDPDVNSQYNEELLKEPTPETIEGTSGNVIHLKPSRKRQVM
jgi:hypothetical protein